MVYPFIGLADGFSHWNLALEICDSGKIISDTLLSPVIPYIQAVTWQVFNSYAVYTLVQAWLFYIAVGMNVKVLLPEKCVWWIIVAQIIVLFPTVYVFPLLLTDSAPIYILIVVMGVLLIQTDRAISKYIYLFAVSALCVGIRVNSLVLMALIVAVLMGNAIRKRCFKRIVPAAMITLGIVTGLVVPLVLLPSSHNASVLGMVWEMTGICTRYPDDVLREKMLDYGNIEEAMNRYGEPYLNSIVWDNDPPYPAFDISGEKAKGITRLYLEQALKNTNHFLSVKAQFVSETMGISNQLISSRRGVHSVDEPTIEYGAISTRRQDDMRELFFSITDAIGIIALRPVCIIALAFILAGLMRVMSIELKKEIVYIFIAMGYYSSFLINTQAHEFRYFAPSFFILLIISICGCIKIIQKMIEKRMLYGRSL